jgi:hypothetical protein
LALLQTQQLNDTSKNPKIRKSLHECNKYTSQSSFTPANYKRLVLQYTGCPRRNVPDFGRVFLIVKYTDITQNRYVQSWMVTEIMARKKCVLLSGQHTVAISWQVLINVCPWVRCGVTSTLATHESCTVFGILMTKVTCVPVVL